MIIQDLKEFFSLLVSNKPLLAIDYGQKKMGIAISDPGRIVSMPIDIFFAEDINDKINSLKQVISKYNVGGLVIGLPVNMNGNFSNQTDKVFKFIKQIDEIFNLPVYLQDERLTSKAADNTLKSLGMNRKKRNNVDDMVAASMILETVLQSIKNLNNNS